MSSDEEEDDWAPALPPHLASKATTTASATAETRKPLGPSLPPHLAQERAIALHRELAQDEGEDGSDDDEAGPMPLASDQMTHEEEATDGVSEFLAREERERKRLEEEGKEKKLQRDEWMIVPPKEISMLAAFDPTKMKARGFRQASTKDQPSTGGVSEMWTETPLERAKRLQEETMGIRKKVVNTKTETEEEKLDAERKRKRDYEMRNAIDKHNRSSRAETLVEMHEKSASQKAQDRAEGKKRRRGSPSPPPAAIWDRDTMMGVSGKMLGEKERKTMLMDAKALGGRFSSGTFS
ncbi:uncharacterized protein L969DRAFT_88972 [Mixia osmundae IAM 14324]|uniref:DUF3752 domain-containing protein n=1 Tax=Mixia osmundae (strain CBS 9802 / IAM 14324 / JCM 22182 / KY 12970) TaxID=764103 RepID=G7E7W6_MIXOS|nr:uncharacterized protein L969DRAFT_88972 [Mixia osmundae IAM 14324]KEI38527.1 hypothetical protein L969DRAFT_88972 [Mixia osmundae IAM 14324]GAA98926.1 hypothetical protein E5Q_05614 [Mixia osmundae IAM 14324]